MRLKLCSAATVASLAAFMMLDAGAGQAAETSVCSFSDRTSMWGGDCRPAVDDPDNQRFGPLRVDLPNNIDGSTDPHDGNGGNGGGNGGGGNGGGGNGGGNGGGGNNGGGNGGGGNDDDDCDRDRDNDRDNDRGKGKGKGKGGKGKGGKGNRGRD